MAHQVRGGRSCQAGWRGNRGLRGLGYRKGHRPAPVGLREQEGGLALRGMKGDSGGEGHRGAHCGFGEPRGWWSERQGLAESSEVGIRTTGMQEGAEGVRTCILSWDPLPH